MPLEPTSQTSTPQKKYVSGRVVQKGNSKNLQGVDVEITTSQGKFTTKTDGSGNYTLTFRINMIPITRKIEEQWTWNPLRDYLDLTLKENGGTPGKATFVTKGRDRTVTWTIDYEYKGVKMTAVGTKTYRIPPTGNVSTNVDNLQARVARSNAISDLEEQIIDYDDGYIFEDTVVGYVANEFPDINYSFPKYNPESRTPYKQDKTIRSVLNEVQLETTVKAVEKDVAQSGTVDTKTAKKVGAGGTRPLPTPQKTIMKAVDTVSNRLIPYIIGILAVFGISQVMQWLNGKKNFQNTKTTCPSRAKLNAQIRKRNRIVKQLNNLFKIIDAATKAIGIALGLLKIFQIIINIFKRLPIPSTIGTPPGPAGGVILSASYGKIIRINEKFDNLKGKLKLFAKIGGIVLTALILLRALLTQALALLKIADEKTQQCLEELGGVEETQIALSAELVALSNQQAEEDNSPVVSNVNGFTMGVEVDPKYKVGTLDRRRAVAKDSKGIVILRGEPSFSATDQILIDELAFYITTNNLKA